MVLKGTDITKIYGGGIGKSSTTAIENLDIIVNKREFVGIMGPSGSGKTSLLNVLSGIDKATSGKVYISGNELTKMNKEALAILRREKIGFVFQNFNLIDSLSVEENIMLPLILDKQNAEDMENKAKRMMELVGIYKLKDKYPINISGGEQQRVSISRAIINDPKIIFADEPSGNLDSKSSKNIMNTFERLNKELHSTILMVTHDPFAASYCDKVLFMVDGKIKLELVKGDESQSVFLDKVMGCFTTVLAGDRSDR